MGFFGKVASAAKKVAKPIASAASKIESVSRPLTRPVRDATKFAFKGTPFEATVRSLTDFDIRKPHIGVARIGYATAANMAAEATGGMSLRITNEIDRKLYGRDVGVMTPGAVKDPASFKNMAQARIGQVQQYGVDTLKGMADDVQRGDFASAYQRADALRNQATSIYNQVSGSGNLPQIESAIRPQALKPEGAGLGPQRTSSTLNRMAGGGGGMPLAASTLAALGMSQERSQAAELAPRSHNNLLVYGLGALAVALVVMKKGV